MRQEAQYGCELEAPDGKGFQGKENKSAMAAAFQNISLAPKVFLFGKERKRDTKKNKEEG